jgi:rhodanese-related sulfurtransferase
MKMTKSQYEELKRDGDAHVLIDVRSRAEWEAGHLEGAISMPGHELPHLIEDAVPNMDTPIIVCCAHGIRALHAANYLTEMGYSNVRSIA